MFKSIVSKSFLICLFSSFAWASAKPVTSKIRQCYGNPAVSATKPFLISISNRDKKTVSILENTIVAEGALVIESRLDLKALNRVVWLVSVNTGKLRSGKQPKVVNAAVDRYVKNLIESLELPEDTILIDCNGLKRALPRAGGMNRGPR